MVVGPERVFGKKKMASDIDRGSTSADLLWQKCILGIGRVLIRS